MNEPTDQKLLPCPGPDCGMCNGEYCHTHAAGPCDCDVIARHGLENTRPPAASPCWEPFKEPFKYDGDSLVDSEGYRVCELAVCNFDSESAAGAFANHLAALMNAATRPDASRTTRRDAVRDELRAVAEQEQHSAPGFEPCIGGGDALHEHLGAGKDDLHAYMRTCVHHTDAERAEAKCPVCQAATIEKLVGGLRWDTEQMAKKDAEIARLNERIFGMTISESTLHEKVHYLTQQLAQSQSTVQELTRGLCETGNELAAAKEMGQNLAKAIREHEHSGISWVNVKQALAAFEKIEKGDSK